MSGKRSRDKGARGERAWRDILRSQFNCPDAERGCQRSGGTESPDVKHGIAGTHAEVKCVESLQLYKAVEQSVAEAGDKIPYVAHKKNRQPWLVTVRADEPVAVATQVYLQQLAVS